MHKAWGKLSGSGVMYPLSAHMLDVAACFAAIASTHAVRRALQATAKRALSDGDLARLSVLAFLHDVGKANAGFQAKCWRAAELPIPPGWPPLAGHTEEALYLLGEERLDHLLIELPLDAMSGWGAACWSLWRASISHHGRPVREPNNITVEIWRPVVHAGQVVYDPQIALREIGQCVREAFAAAFEDGPPLPDNPEFAHLFAGLVQFADWLGSDTRFFPHSTPSEEHEKGVWQAARNAVRTIGFDAAALRSALSSLPSFSDVFSVDKPRPIQSRMADTSLGPLVILESETGSGKTEAALWRFAHLFQSGQVDGLYFALPTRVAATQLFDRVCRFADRLWQGTGQAPPLVVRALAGYENANGQDMVKLPDFQVLWADHPDDQKAQTRWAAESSKRFLAAPLAVGTIDQALLGALQVRHAHMRHCLLARSLLVVDEVHASDAYMATLLGHLLQAHLNAGGHALLLSATLGASARHCYQRLTAPGADLPPLAQAVAVPYPALSVGAHILALPDSGRSKQVHWMVQDCIDKPEAIAHTAIAAAQQGAKVLVIRNTVPSAVATFKATETLAVQHGLREALFNLRGIPTVHHSRYSREDRPALDQAVEQQIGKLRGTPRQGCIVVGTQTLEQSLDIDADLLITDLCPMDVLLQRVGRLHRHARTDQDRPKPYRQARAIVLVPTGYRLDACLHQSSHGLGRFREGGGIYTDLRMLEATLRLIRGSDSHVIPRDNRELVERATHPEVLAALDSELGSDWQAHGQAISGEHYAKTVLANFSALPFEQAFQDEAGNPLTFPNSDQRISSRLGAADYLLTFDPPQPGPFGNPIKHLPVRHHLWPKDVSPDEPPRNVSASADGGFTFNLGNATFYYSRLGLERDRARVTGATL